MENIKMLLNENATLLLIAGATLAVVIVALKITVFVIAAKHITGVIKSIKADAKEAERKHNWQNNIDMSIQSEMLNDIEGFNSEPRSLMFEQQTKKDIQRHANRINRLQDLN